MGLFSRPVVSDDFVPAHPAATIGGDGLDGHRKIMQHLAGSDPAITAALSRDEKVLCYALVKNKVLVLTDRQIMMVRRRKIVTRALSTIKETKLLRLHQDFYAIHLNPLEGDLMTIDFSYGNRELALAQEVCARLDQQLKAV